MGNNDVEYLIIMKVFKDMLGNAKELYNMVNADMTDYFKPTVTLLTEEIKIN